MKLTSCPFEKEVRQLVARGQWPAAGTPELRAHVSGCRACGDLVLISEAFQNARVDSLAAARPVAPAVLLWRAQLRKRTAAMERVGRPLLGAQIFACAVTQWASMSSGSLAGSGWGWMVVVPGLAMLLLLGGVAVYFATDKS
jgi:hypothetical protein